MTALHWAALNGDAELASMLLYAGANVGAKTRIGGYTPLHLAAQVGNASVIAPLVAAGAQVGAATATGATALMQAAHSGSADSVRILLENGADPNVKETANGQTALMFAAAADRVDVVKLLLARGADVGATSRVEDFSALTTSAEVDQNGVAASGAGTAARRHSRRDAAVQLQRADRQARRAGGAALRGPAGRDGDALRRSSRAAPTSTSAAPATGRRRSWSRPSTATSIWSATCSTRAPIPTWPAKPACTPLYAVINVQWQPRSFYPQPRAYLQQKTDYLDADEEAARQGRRSERSHQSQAWFTAVQLRPAAHR